MNHSHNNCEVLFSTNGKFPFKGAGGSAKNDHDFPFSNDVELC